MPTDPPNGLTSEHAYVEKKSGEVKSISDIQDDEGEEKDIDTLIEELESLDGYIELNIQESHQTGRLRPVSDDLLQTDCHTGLSANEVAIRRKKFGSNEMKEAKENLMLKFVWFFVGPVQFVMEVCIS